MKRRAYGQYCGLSRALELVGDRWALLIVRDLTARPHRFTGLLDGLAGIPTSVLSSRLKTLEEAGIVERAVASAPQHGILYALTPAGQSLKPIISALGHWGTAQLDAPRGADAGTPESMVMTLRGAFDPFVAAGLNVSWEIRLSAFVLHAVIVDGSLEVGLGPLPYRPDLAITFQDGKQTYLGLMQAARCGMVELDGRRSLLHTFLHIFAPSHTAHRTVWTDGSMHSTLRRSAS
ncbi:helix-turn-helix domain-containing protein [Streptomyces sp. KS_5]|uniref:winged helix-turn-helix transcriptional regulator n=1 Tax=Streptomyces sp. KS_5 TaxID=1881018 RepID=UPI000896E414|nr:helix-turn-helix domain-containing protein [Streptomyces sp. KS_5]SEE35527.1 transcriptional regulator, HxlR family [Streptomyces sp. KS_5]